MFLAMEIQHEQHKVLPSPGASFLGYLEITLWWVFPVFPNTALISHQSSLRFETLKAHSVKSDHSQTGGDRPLPIDGLKEIPSRTEFSYSVTSSRGASKLRLSHCFG